MFDHAILQESVSGRQREAIRQVLDRVLANGSFTYTDLLMAPEPARTLALEYLDGVQSSNGIPATAGHTPKDIGLVRLICIDKNDTIKVSQWGTRNIYGSTIPAPPQKYLTDLGNDAMVPDTFPVRVARNVLRQRGFPVRDLSSRGTNSGTIVEWKWLERRVNEPDCPPELVEIHQKISERITAPATAPPATKSKSPGGANAQLPVHP